MDRIIGEDHDILIIIEIILGETFLENEKIIEVKFLDVDMEGIMEMATLE